MLRTASIDQSLNFIRLGIKSEHRSRAPPGREIHTAIVRDELIGIKGVEVLCMEYGSDLGEWRRRSALKMWTGWPTFPMVFHKGTLIGGASELGGLVATGEVRVKANLADVI